MCSIRLRTATKERPENAAFVAPVVAFAFNRQIAIRPRGQISIAVMLQRWGADIDALAGNDNKSQGAAPLAGRFRREGEGEFEGRGRRGLPSLRSGAARCGAQSLLSLSGGALA